MYPKKTQGNPRQKHEQLKQLLVNKFRSKYCGPSSTEVDELLI